MWRFDQERLGGATVLVCNCPDAWGLCLAQEGKDGGDVAIIYPGI